MASVKDTMSCLGIDTSGDTSILGDLFGFLRRRVPTDPDTTVTARVSVLDQVRQVQHTHLNVNVIRVGFDALAGGATALDQAHEKLDYCVYRIRSIYDQVDLGVGRVQHWFITAAASNGRDDIGTKGEVDDLVAEWSVPNDGVDAFVVRNISVSGLLGRATGIPGGCDKEGKEDGVVAGAIDAGFESLSRTFAHEIGHHLGLEHNHGDDCPGSKSKCNRLMAQTKCATSCGDGVRAAVNLTSGEGSDMRGHCSARSGCP